MRKRGLSRIVKAIEQLSWTQRQQLMERLKAPQSRDEAYEVIEQRMKALRMCAHCHSWHVVRIGQARGLQRGKCRGCGRTCNALTGSPLARLCYRDKWLEQSQALIDGLSITKAAQQIEVARSTSFRWRHRFLALPQAIKAAVLHGIADLDETCIPKSCKVQRSRLPMAGRKAGRRGGRAKRRGLSVEHDAVLVGRDRLGATSVQIVLAPDTAHLEAVLQPLLPFDMVLCIDGSPALAAAARHIKVECHAVNVSAGQRVLGAWHVDNVNGYFQPTEKLVTAFQRRGLLVPASLPRLVWSPGSVQFNWPQTRRAAGSGHRSLMPSLNNAN